MKSRISLRHITSVQGKRVNLKTGVSRKQSTPNFPKNEHLVPPDTHTMQITKLRYQGVRNVLFRKIWRALFS